MLSFLLLLSSCIPIVAADDDGVTKLMKAARDGEKKPFGKELKKAIKKKSIDARDAYGWTALTYAVVRGDEKMSKDLVANGVDLNVIDEDGRSLLLHAIKYDHESIARLLIEKGALLDRRDHKGVRAIGLAWTRAKDGIVALLERSGVPPPTLDDKRMELYNPIPNAQGPRILRVPAFPRLVGLLPPGDSQLDALLLIGADGRVKKVRLLTGLPNGASRCFMEEIKELECQPAIRDGKPVDAWMPFSKKTIGLRRYTPPPYTIQVPPPPFAR